MPTSISRRDVLKNLAMGVSAGSVLQIIPMEAAELAHRMISEERAQSPAGAYTPKFFSAHVYQTLRTLCQAIIPADSEAGGAIEAGAPEFIDLLTSENEEYQLTLGGGIAWLDSQCNDRYGKAYGDCAAADQKTMLDQIAFRENARKDPTLAPGVKFFAFLRDLTTDGFVSSQIGIKYLQYIGNTFLDEFPGCPPLPES
jgi:gluconate 2-dehydrogenase gamma chain